MHLFLVDSSIFVFRAWYGPDRERVNRGGEPNQAFVGFTDFVYRLLTEQAPHRVVFAFDESLSSSARKSIYGDYKANRSPAPQELKRQFAWCRQWLELLGISCVSSPLWEADDLIGSLRRFHASADLPTAILTADKDLAQLVGEGDLWWSYLDDKRLDYRAVCRKFGVRPDQIAAQLALAGDKADNIPGVPQVGMKTASRLLKKYDTLDALLENLEDVGKMKFRYAAAVQRSLQDHRNLLDISRQLTPINCDIGAMRDVDTARRSPQVDALREVMTAQAFEVSRLRRWDAYFDGPLVLGEGPGR